MREYPINTYEQVPKGGVFISPFYTPGRSQSFSGWAVMRIGYSLAKLNTRQPAWYEPKGGWLFHGFDKMAALKAAQEAAGTRYGITKWKRNAQGDYIDANAGYKPLQREIDRKVKKEAL